MALFAWIMLALAIWHFTVFLPDHFVGGIVGAFLVALVGGVISGYALSGFSLPSQDDTTVLTVLEAVPGTLIALGILYAIGSAREREQTATA